MGTEGVGEGGRGGIGAGGEIEVKESGFTVSIHRNGNGNIVGFNLYQELS